MLVLLKDRRADPLCTAEHVKISNADLLNDLTIVEQYRLGTQDSPNACPVAGSQALFVQRNCLRTVCGGEEHRVYLRLEHGWLRMHADDPVLWPLFRGWFIYWPAQHQAILKFGFFHRCCFRADFRPDQ